MEKLNLGWLRQARRDRRLTIAKAARAIGKDRSTLWRYENGVTPLTVDTLFQILGIYGKSIVEVVEKEKGNENI